jgi:hypothetical protein
MEHSAGLRKIARLNCAGGGQVVVDRQFAHIGHMDSGVGTSIADVSDPLAPVSSLKSLSQRAFIRTRCGLRTVSCW